MEAEQVGLEAGRQATADQPAGGGGSWEYRLRKYLLLLATLVATVTYGAAFNPPGGVWQDADPAARRIAGDPIIRETNYRRYLAFFYSNATAFASSLVVIVLVLILAVLHERGSTSLAPLRALRVVMVLDLLSLMGAYAAGTFRDRLTQVYSILLLAGVVVYLAVHRALVAWRAGTAADGDGSAAAEKLRKVLMLLATFALSVTYLAGLSTPGGFWDHAEGTFRPGRAVLKGGRHDARLKAFFVFNTTAFVASLLIVIILLEKKLCFSPNVRIFELYGFIAVTLVGLVGAYSAGSCREVDTTVYVNSLVGAVIVFILVQAAIVRFLWGEAMRNSCLRIKDKVLGCLPRARKQPCLGQSTHDGSNGNANGSAEQPQTQMIEQARSLVLLLATLAAAITYQAGLNPPGGLWQGDGVGAGGRRYMAGDPILLTTNPRRYKAFYYCNSAAFVASLVAIVLLRIKTLHRHNALEAAMILDLFGLIGAYAAGSCRDVRTSVCAMAIAGAVLLYVAFHVFVSKKLDHKDASSRGHDEASLAKEKKAAEMLEKRRKRLLLFAILAATITYQAGLTPPGGFLVKGDDVTRRQAGDPVLLNNYQRRYKAFFYCNSVSFMLSIALIILLAFPKMYRPAIRSHALAVCTAAGMAFIMGAYAAGCTQHLKTSIYTILLAAFVLLGVLGVVVFWAIHRPNDTDYKASKEDNKKIKDEEERRIHGKRKYLMLLGILVASVTYQAGLAPPGGVWQSNLGGHAAGNPVMHDNRRPRYLAFFYSNSTSFVASVVVIVLLLPPPELLNNKWRPAWWLGVMDFTIVLDLLGLLIAYAAGSSRSWKTAGYVSALVIAVLGYFVIHVLVSCVFRRGEGGSSGHCAEQKSEEGANGQVRPALTN